MMPKIRKVVRDEAIINLFYMNPVSYGGHVSFTVHLMRGLRACGWETRLFKVGSKNTEKKCRQFGNGEEYRNVTLEDAVRLANSNPTVITAPSKPKAEAIQAVLEGSPARLVIHDPAEFKHGWDWKAVKKPLVIRTSMLQYFDDAVFIPHPYDALNPIDTFPSGKREWNGVSVSRIDFDKHTEVILDANRLLTEAQKVHIYGFENRIYTRFNIVPHYPEWEQSKVKFPRELYYAVENLCGKAVFMVDMSIIKGDGGGTQYTFLEAMDAGCCMVLNDEWILDGHLMEPGVNCISVKNGVELADTLRKFHEGDKKFVRRVSNIRKKARLILNDHNAKILGKDWGQAICQF